MPPDTPTLAVIGSRGLPPAYGGVERALSDLAPRLVQRGFRVIVYGHGNPSTSPGYSRWRDVEVFTAPRFLSSFGNAGVSLFSVLHAIVRVRPDAVLLMASGPSALSVLVRPTGAKVIAAIRALDSQRDKWGLIRQLILRFGEWCANTCAHACTVNSEAMRDYFRARGYQPVYIPNGAPSPTTPSPDVLAKYGARAEAYALFAARLVPEKRCHVLLRAYRELPPEDRVPLLIAGGYASSTDYRAQLRELAEGLPVRFLGHVPEDDLQHLVAACRFFVLPSVVEGMSNSLLAAMANARCCIASGIRENADVLGDCGIVFPPDDSAALAGALRDAASRPDWAADLGRAAQRRVVSHYSWDRVATEYSELLHNLLAARR